jgi:ABC-type glycerol-3-phosphate transport system substrate-binding protein
MKKRTFILLIISMILLYGCKNNNSVTNAEDGVPVFFTSNISPEGVMNLFEYVKENIQGEHIGIKVHFGEDGNEYFVPAVLVEPLCKALNATLVETNTAY